MIKKLLSFVFIATSLLTFALGVTVKAEGSSVKFPEVVYYKGKVTEIIQTDHQTKSYKNEEGNQINQIDTKQVVRIVILNGGEKGKQVEVEHGWFPSDTDSRLLAKGQKVIISKTSTPDSSFYGIEERYRMDPMIFILILFVALVIIFAKEKGIKALAGIGISLLAVCYILVPNVLAGVSPIWLSLFTAVVIAVSTTYLFHGVNKKTTIALGCLIITLLVSTGLSVLFVDLVQLFGYGSEDAMKLQVGKYQNLDLRGVLLGGIIIGTLGVLSYVTNAQATTVSELKKSNEDLSIKDLYNRGMLSGKEHIASMINILMTIYIGTSLVLFLFFAIDSRPFWVTLNTELISEEIIRILAGSIALTLAVPITTITTAYFLKKEKSFKPFVQKLLSNKQK